MEHFLLFVFSSPLNIVFLFYPPSQRLKVFYVLSMLFQFLETHGCVSIFLPVSILLVLPFLHSNRHTYAQGCTLHPRIPQWDSHSGVRRVPQTALNLSETLMPLGFKCPWLLGVRISVCIIASNWVYQVHLITQGDLSLHDRFPWGVNDLNDISCYF